MNKIVHIMTTTDDMDVLKETSNNLDQIQKNSLNLYGNTKSKKEPYGTLKEFNELCKKVNTKQLSIRKNRKLVIPDVVYTKNHDMKEELPIKHSTPRVSFKI